MPNTKFTPKEYAKQLRVSPAKVIRWIRRGELRAVNVATSMSGRPRYLISLSEIEAFENLRATLPPQPKSRTKPKKKRDPNFIEYI
jgi:excisionase family DNA binding protein